MEMKNAGEDVSEVNDSVSFSSSAEEKFQEGSEE